MRGSPRVTAVNSRHAAAARRRRRRADAVHGPGVRDRGLPLRSRPGRSSCAVPVSQAYTSVSFYTRNDVAYYAINDRSAGRRVIELDLMTEAQHAELPEEEDVTAADRLIIESPTTTGLIVLKALGAPNAGLMHAGAGARCSAATCKVQTDPG